MLKKKVILTPYQEWKIQKELLKAKAKRLKTTPDKLKAEEEKKMKVLKEIAQEISKYKQPRKKRF